MSSIRADWRPLRRWLMWQADWSEDDVEAVSVQIAQASRMRDRVALTAWRDWANAWMGEVHAGRARCAEAVARVKECLRRDQEARERARSVK